MIFVSKEFQFWTEKILLFCCQYFWAQLVQEEKAGKGPATSYPWTFLCEYSWSAAFQRSASARKGCGARRGKNLCSRRKSSALICIRWSQARIKHGARKKKLVQVPSSFLLSLNASPFRAWGTCSTPEYPNILSVNVNTCESAPFSHPHRENTGCKESPWKWKLCFSEELQNSHWKTQVLLI